MNKTAVHLALKDEYAALVRECGGLNAVAGLIGIKKSQIQRITDPSTIYHFNPLHIAALEATSGNPRVSRLLAKLRGYELDTTNEPLPLLSSDVEDWADEKIQSTANFSACARNFLRGQRTPRTLEAMKAAAQRSYELSWAILQNIRVIASKQREIA